VFTSSYPPLAARARRSSLQSLDERVATAETGRVLRLQRAGLFGTHVQALYLPEGPPQPSRQTSYDASRLAPGSRLRQSGLPGRY